MDRSGPTSMPFHPSGGRAPSSNPRQIAGHRRDQVTRSNSSRHIKVAPTSASQVTTGQHHHVDSIGSNDTMDFRGIDCPAYLKANNGPTMTAPLNNKRSGRRRSHIGSQAADDPVTADPAAFSPFSDFETHSLASSGCGGSQRSTTDLTTETRTSGGSVGLGTGGSVGGSSSSGHGRPKMGGVHSSGTQQRRSSYQSNVRPVFCGNEADIVGGNMIDLIQKTNSNHNTSVRPVFCGNEADIVGGNMIDLIQKTNSNHSASVRPVFCGDEAEIESGNMLDLITGGPRPVRRMSSCHAASGTTNLDAEDTVNTMRRSASAERLHDSAGHPRHAPCRVMMPRGNSRAAGLPSSYSSNSISTIASRRGSTGGSGDVPSPRNWSAGTGGNGRMVMMKKSNSFSRRQQQSLRHSDHTQGNLQGNSSHHDSNHSSVLSHSRGHAAVEVSAHSSVSRTSSQSGARDPSSSRHFQVTPQRGANAGRQILSAASPSSQQQSVDRTTITATSWYSGNFDHNQFCDSRFHQGSFDEHDDFISDYDGFHAEDFEGNEMLSPGDRPQETASVQPEACNDAFSTPSQRRTILSSNHEDKDNLMDQPNSQAPSYKAPVRNRSSSKTRSTAGGQGPRSSSRSRKSTSAISSFRRKESFDNMSGESGHGEAASRGVSGQNQRTCKQDHSNLLESSLQEKTPSDMIQPAPSNRRGSLNGSRASTAAAEAATKLSKPSHSSSKSRSSGAGQISRARNNIATTEKTNANINTECPLQDQSTSRLRSNKDRALADSSHHDRSVSGRGRSSSQPRRPREREATACSGPSTAEGQRRSNSLSGKESRRMRVKESTTSASRSGPRRHMSESLDKGDGGSRSTWSANHNRSGFPRGAEGSDLKFNGDDNPSTDDESDARHFQDNPYRQHRPRRPPNVVDDALNVVGTLARMQLSPEGTRRTEVVRW